MIHLYDTFILQRRRALSSSTYAIKHDPPAIAQILRANKKKKKIKKTAIILFVNNLSWKSIVGSFMTTRSIWHYVRASLYKSSRIKFRLVTKVIDFCISIYFSDLIAFYFHLFIQQKKMCDQFPNVIIKCK